MTPSHPMHLRTSASIDKHVIAMLNRSTSLLEHRDLSGKLVAAVTWPRSIVITPGGSVPDVRLQT